MDENGKFQSTATARGGTYKCFNRFHIANVYATVGTFIIGHHHLCELQHLEASSPDSLMPHIRCDNDSVGNVRRSRMAAAGRCSDMGHNQLL